MNISQLGRLQRNIIQSIHEMEDGELSVYDGKRGSVRAQVTCRRGPCMDCHRGKIQLYTVEIENLLKRDLFDLVKEEVWGKLYKLKTLRYRWW